ncbi:2Fe-2S iron-sulfur cluster-binding protein [uncultured Shewanella sp.]|uniref:2Fe-2S iron-sulfur cluster-binding protein n=1 Tax=uncultured Shewanella sp. TaxID=173975 RepID=UPI00260BD986|nr:2Fe-2S iron-sulfur cluster-binding protein [uncultured Shewanella sp.]
MNKNEKRLRNHDIVPTSGQSTRVWVDNQSVDAIPGENILSVLFAVGKRTITKNDHGKVTGAYCGMGVCHCCTVKVNGQHKVKACQTLIEPEMQIITQVNRLHDEGL